MPMHSRTLAALALGVVAFSLAAGRPAAADETITLVERATTDTIVDIGPKGDSLGDVLAFANEVYDESNSKLVGNDNGSCVRTVVGQAWECIWTLTLEKGQITVEGPFYDTKDSVLAVTGGTGRYDEASGSMQLHARDAKGSAYDFVYNLK